MIGDGKPRTQKLWFLILFVICLFVCLFLFVQISPPQNLPQNAHTTSFPCVLCCVFQRQLCSRQTLQPLHSRQKIRPFHVLQATKGCLQNGQ